MVTLAEIDRLDALVNANPDDDGALRRWNEAVTTYERETGDVLLWCDDCGARIPATTAQDAHGYYLRGVRSGHRGGVMADTARTLLTALTADEWAGWGFDDGRGEYQCFYCHAYTDGDDHGHQHKPDCPLRRARVLLGTQPDDTEEA